VYEASPGAKYKFGGIPLVTILGVLGFIFGAVMLVMFMFDARLGLTSPLAYGIVFGVLAVSWIWYMISKNTQKSKGINVDFAFKEIPPE
jgi:APA family basic amino acid/polyamine antiporter